MYIYCRWPRIIPYGNQPYDHIQIPVNISKRNICGKRTVNIYMRCACDTRADALAPIHAGMEYGYRRGMCG